MSVESLGSATDQTRFVFHNTVLKKVLLNSSIHSFLCVRITAPMSHWTVLAGIFYLCVENCALLACYAACSGNSLLIGSPKTSVLNCYYTPRNSPEERGSCLISGGSLKSWICVVWRRCELLTMCVASVIDEWNSVDH